MGDEAGVAGGAAAEVVRRRLAELAERLAVGKSEKKKVRITIFVITNKKS